jgi:CheY-like chemotaxis protein
MPALNGYSVAERIRGTPGLERTKLVAISAFSHADHARRADEAGFDYRLTKPADPSELERILGMIDNIVRLAEKTEQLARENVALAKETKGLLADVKSDIQEVKKDVKELRAELHQIKSSGSSPEM